MLDVARLAWHHQRHALVGWAAGIALMAGITIALYPIIGPEYEELFDAMPEGLREAFGGEASLGTLEGFLSVEFQSYIPLLFAIYAISQGARSLAGEEELGTFDILLSQPVPRIQVVAQKTLALSLGCLVLALSAGIGLVVGGLLAGVDGNYGRIFMTGLDLWPISMFFLGLGVLGSAVFHQRVRASVVATIYTAAAYFINLFAPLAEVIEPFQWLSIFKYYLDSRPLSGAVDPVYWLVGLGGAAVMFAVATWQFDRKDLTG